MKTTLKRLAYGVLAGCGLPRLLHVLFHRGHLAILMYHGVVRRPLPIEDWCFLSEEAFAGHVDYLRRRFDVLPLESAFERLQAGTLRRPTVAITFDDGYRNNHEVAFPLLKTAGLPATIFLNAGLVGGDRTVWFCRLLEALIRTSRADLWWRNERYLLDTPEARGRASARLQERLKPLAHPELLAALEEIEDRLQVTRDPAFDPSSPFRIMDRAAVRAMADSGLIAFGAHTESHAILAHLPEPDQRREIETSLREVAAMTGRPCSLFSFPNGRAEDYDGRALGILRECGVTAAVTSIEGPNRPGMPPLELRRYGVGADMTLGDFILTAYHVKNGLRQAVR
jgi:peptidoglycan/xylan/chitin deacetylase (PgdA/CDA1 family)